MWYRYYQPNLNVLYVLWTIYNVGRLFNTILTFNVQIIYMIKGCKEDLYNLLCNKLINKNFRTKDKGSQRYNLASAC